MIPLGGIRLKCHYPTVTDGKVIKKKIVTLIIASKIFETKKSRKTVFENT